MFSKQTQLPSSLVLPSSPIHLPVTMSTKQREHADSVPKAINWKSTENLKTYTNLEEGIPKATDSQTNKWNHSYSASVGLDCSIVPHSLSGTSFKPVALLTFFLLLSISFHAPITLSPSASSSPLTHFYCCCLIQTKD